MEYVLVAFLLFYLVFAGVVIFKSPKVGFALTAFALLFLCIMCYPIVMMVDYSPFVGREIAVLIAIGIIGPAYLFAYLISKFGRRWFMIITAGSVIWLLSWGLLSYGYLLEITDVLAKTCHTCQSFLSDDYQLGNYRYLYGPNINLSSDDFRGIGSKYLHIRLNDYPFDHCIIWDNPLATTQCFYPSVALPIGLTSLMLALVGMGWCFWLTQEVDSNLEEVDYATSHS